MFARSKWPSPLSPLPPPPPPRLVVGEGMRSCHGGGDTRKGGDSVVLVRDDYGDGDVMVMVRA